MPRGRGPGLIQLGFLDTLPLLPYWPPLLYPHFLPGSVYALQAYPLHPHPKKSHSCLSRQIFAVTTPIVESLELSRCSFFILSLDNSSCTAYVSPT